MSNEIKTTAQVSMTISVQLMQPWDQKESLEEVYKRAKSEAYHKVTSLIQNANAPMRILNEMKIIAILAETER